jgi:hypothetical protein
MEFAKVVRGSMNRWVIVHKRNEDLAWSGARWVMHNAGLPLANYQVCNFASRQDAEEYVRTRTQTFA